MEQNEALMNDKEYLLMEQGIMRLLGIDLQAYKSTQMRRRLTYFMNQCDARSFSEFCRKLESSPALLDRLRNHITINVSEFFRDEAPFNYLKSTVLPQLVRTRNRLKIWSAGCSGGQEPYSIAMLLDLLAANPGSYRILGTDIDSGVLKTAVAGGPYTSESLRNVGPSMLSRYFTASGGGYKVNDVIRQRVEFKMQNLLSDPFEKGFDLIACRNVTIYFTNEAKATLNRKFYDALSPGGILFIGGTETSLEMTALGFRPIAPQFFAKGEPAIRSASLKTPTVLTGQTRG